ncbi:MAG: response regulator transcription factor [Gammaproteobacteria bacterium]|jgi:two-component system response regulator QseB|nr:response regulator transcription factor [Gammaproteobacteria bacterium]
MRLLLVEDDEQLGRGIQKALMRDGDHVDWLTDGAQALAAIRSDNFELILLDLQLPGKDGISVLQTMRKESINTPVLIMTARDTVDERVLGLDSGADDYVVKPVELKELRSRVRALSRRSHGFAAPEISLGELRINSASQQVWYRGEEIELNRREFVVLAEFANRPGQVLTRSHLEGVLYGWSEGVESNALEVHIHHLRKKLDNKLIKTVRGVGYKLDADSD